MEQPYKDLPTVKVRTSLQSVSINVEENEQVSSALNKQPKQPEQQQQVKQGHAKQEAPINKRAQRTAFPPNYIHSLDSSHMMLTALECNKRGVAFAGGMGVRLTTAAPVLFPHLFYFLMVVCPYLWD